MLVIISWSVAQSINQCLLDELGFKFRRLFGQIEVDTVSFQTAENLPTNTDILQDNIQGKGKI